MSLKVTTTYSYSRNIPVDTKNGDQDILVTITGDSNKTKQGALTISYRDDQNTDRCVYIRDLNSRVLAELISVLTVCHNLLEEPPKGVH